jgi:chemotaxis protein methyltransferase CheR
VTAEVNSQGFDRGMPSISDSGFRRFSELIYSLCGIKLPPHKKTMLEARLRRRLRSLGFGTFDEYGDYVFSPLGMENELVSMINEVTTNKTDFFREPAHYPFLVDRVLPALMRDFEVGIGRPLRLWSAGCSTGEEPYTLAMVLSEFADRVPDFDFSIFATDISTKVLDAARLGIYRVDKVEPVPEGLKKKYLLRSRDPEKKEVRIVPALRGRVAFRRLNFMDEDFGLAESFDIIFCRNVIIYFDRPTQERLLKRFCQHLPRDRYIFMGHSETLNGLRLPLKQVAPSIYQRI